MLQSDSHKRSEQTQASDQQGIRQGGNKDGGHQGDFSLETPQIEKPKGGGAIQGIDEKFQVNASTGTLSFSIPLPLSEGRSGFTPGLQLSYNSGVGNGLFGLGWQLSIPSIKRKTEKQLPQYNEEDTFILSGVEDLVPQLDSNGNPVEFNEGGYHIKRYRPRIENNFARIEQISKDNEVWWKVTSAENVKTLFGRGKDYRISDSKNPQTDKVSFFNQ